jgi:4-amino-4-deoxy-L-arabinose transferase-like glycosyltransferase
VRAVALAALVAAAIAFVGLGEAPFVDPPEGFHAEIAREMLARGDFVTPRLNSVRYFDKPPIPYWLMSVSLSVMGPTPGAARFWGAVALVGVAAVTAATGVLLRGPRFGFLAGLFAAANLGLFLYARIVKPDLLFVLFLSLAWLGVAIAWRVHPVGLVLFYGALGFAALAKDLLGALGPLAVLAVGLVWAGERHLSRWFPWWGGAILVAIAAPWYLLVEARNRGFLWYTIVDNKLLNIAQQRVFPDEDVPLRALEFLLVTAAAFLPWIVAAPLGVVRVFRDPERTPEAGLWRVYTVWALAVLGATALSPFKLPHYGLPVFPALALLAARAWDDALDAPARSRRVLVPALIVAATLAAAFGAAVAGALALGGDTLGSVDVATRNLAARGHAAPAPPHAVWRPILLSAGGIFAIAAVTLAIASYRRIVALGAAAAVGAMIAFLPLAGQGMAEFARIRSAEPVIAALLIRAGSAADVIHEGALENSGSLLLALGRPVRVVNGLASNLAYGATFPDSRDLFWDEARLAREWRAPGRRFLVSVVAPGRSVAARLDPVHAITRSGTHWLYSNQTD